MAISFRSSVGLFESALQLRSTRAELLASNLANADTPNYKARDINFKQALAAQFDNGSQNSSMAGNQARHLQGGTGAAGGELFYRTPTQPAMDGNTVEEQLEHTAFMENNLEFQSTFTLLNGRFRGLMSAIKGD